jgi:ribonuclease D
LDWPSAPVFAIHPATFAVIDNEPDLKALIPKVRSARWVAVDTEADSLHAYPEKLCLIQISVEGADFLVDPLAAVDITPLFAALQTHEVIFHAADYDLRLLQKHHRFVPQSVFDTMLAARLVGLTQFGLGYLVETMLGVKLDKAPQRANWAIRPLTERMSRYAINDTRHLKPLADKLRADLKALGRLEWHREWCARLIGECAVGKESDPDRVWRIKGSAVLPPRALAILRELWGWREQEATAANRPPYFVLAHETLLKVSAAAANQERVDGLLPRGLSQRRRKSAGEAVQRGLKLPKGDLPQPFKHKYHRPTEAERKRFVEFARRRDKHAQRLNLDPTVIASRADLARLAQDWEEHAPGLMKWQRELLR